MTQKAVRGRNRIVLVIVAAVVAIPAVLLTAAAIGFTWAASAVERLGEPVAEPVVRTVALAGPGRPGDPPAAPTPPARLAIDLEDGIFKVRPGPPGGGVRVEGTYAPAYYELTHRREPAAGGGGRAVTVRLERSRSLLVQLVAHATHRTSSTPNDLTVTIPRDVPLAVALTIRAGESRIDLGGLSLTDLAVDLAMGDHRLDFSEPAAVALRRMRLDGGMGEIRFDRLGNARAAEVEASGHMGSVTVDLGGAWPARAVADVTLNNLMGELRLRVPTAVRLLGAGDPAIAGGGGRAAGPGAPDGDAPVVRLQTSSTMGELRLTRY